MNIELAKKMPYEEIHKKFKSHLKSLGLVKNTVSPMVGDAFYLWNNVGYDEFWRVVTSEDFETEGRDALFKALSANSAGNAVSNVSSYLSALRSFRKFVYSDVFEQQEIEDMKALKHFLLDIECLDRLTEWTSKVNFFDILQITRTEIRHSNTLGWLLDPNENHGLGVRVIKGFIQHVATTFIEDEDVFDTLMMDCHDFVIQREWNNIDILAVSHSEEFVLCIENKTDSSEHDNQLNRYRKILDETYPSYEKMYIYLSPDGREASDTEHWCAMSYTDVLGIVEKACNNVSLQLEVKVFIDNYLETVRRSIVGDERLVQICAEIYAKHKRALDLIFENRPDRALDVANIFKKWAIEKAEQGELEVVLEKCGKTFVSFKTKIMSEILPDSEDANSGWGTKNHYSYLIKNNDGNSFYIYLVLSSQNMTEAEMEISDRLGQYAPAKQKENWKWRTIYTTPTVKLQEELEEEKIFAQLDKSFEKIKEFEEKLRNEFGK